MLLRPGGGNQGSFLGLDFRTGQSDALLRRVSVHWKNLGNYIRFELKARRPNPKENCATLGLIRGRGPSRPKAVAPGRGPAKQDVFIGLGCEAGGLVYSSL